MDYLKMILMQVNALSDSLEVFDGIKPKALDDEINKIIKASDKIKSLIEDKDNLDFNEINCESFFKMNYAHQLEINKAFDSIEYRLGRDAMNRLMSEMRRK